MGVGEAGELIRCTSCDTTFTSEQTAGHNGCPACGTRSVPCDPALDFLLPINWHEVRILVQWADNYVLSCKMPDYSERTWEAIKRRIRQHAPPGAGPLTLYDEMDGLRAAGYDATLHQAPQPPEAA